MEMLGDKREWFKLLDQKFGWQHRARIIDGECKPIGNGKKRMGRLDFKVEVKEAKKYAIYQHTALLICGAGNKCTVKLEMGPGKSKKLYTRKTPTPQEAYPDPEV